MIIPETFPTVKMDRPTPRPTPMCKDEGLVVATLSADVNLNWAITDKTKLTNINVPNNSARNHK